MGEVGSKSVPIFTATDFHNSMDKKIDDIRTATSSAATPVFADYKASLFDHFESVDVGLVKSILMTSPAKQCSLDSLPTWLMNDCVSVLAPCVTSIINASLRTGYFPLAWAIVSLLLKKSGLDESTSGNYRPVSNLTFLSKVFERVVHRQMSPYLIVNKLMPEFQSAYRPDHSTETAVLKVFSDIIDAIDKGQLALLSLLDLSAAFGTLLSSYPTTAVAEVFWGWRDCDSVIWFVSHWEDTVCVPCGWNDCTTKARLWSPQGSVLGPLVFILYTADSGLLIRTHGLLYHCYADDTQIYFFCQPTECGALKSKVIACISGIAVWMKSNRPKLNPSKSEFVWCATTRRLYLADMTFGRWWCHAGVVNHKSWRLFRRQYEFDDSHSAARSGIVLSATANRCDKMIDINIYSDTTR